MSISIDGKLYSASNAGGSTWMVKRYQSPNANDDESNYVETLIDLDTADPEAVIRAAIERNSWT